uniref:Protein TIC 214 n=1 Tax=Bryocarpum himalaicum TaxID=199607 RepID=A0A8B0R7V6_9ERIC|nr:Ycf1 protein [Bryocarpum himalaicum]QTW91237.1 Ycf1 protein [Bryocarpum himalaicum]
MILKYFLLGNLVSLCLKIINSVVVVGLYYGFLTTFSIGPSYLFLLRAQVMEEGTEKKVSATTGFITGQLMMFISIYYAPLHLALGRPHTITVLALPYLLFHFFWNNHKNYGSTTRNSMRNLSIQCVFLNNLIFQLFNHFILPSSMLARLVNIYMFRCNNKMLFVTSSFVGWLIGHIFFMKWLGLVLVWIRQNSSIRSNVLIRSTRSNVLIRFIKYLVSELRNSMARIFSILLFITCVYYLGRIPSPILTKKLKETSKTEERNIEIETTYETKRTKQEQEGSTEEDPSPSLFSEEKEDTDKIDETEEIRVNRKEKKKEEFLKKTYYQNRQIYEASYLDLDKNEENNRKKILENQNLFWFEKPFVTLIFNYNKWNRPMRYIKNHRFANSIRNEMSHYFFYTCQSYGKKKISFSFPPNLSTFWEMIQRKRPLPIIKKDELYNHWVYTNQEKKKNLKNELINRMEALDKGSFYVNILEKKIRLCNEGNKKEYLRQIYDPFLNGPHRGQIYFFFSPLIINEIVTERFVEINKIHTIFFTDTHLQNLEQKIDRFEKKTLSKKRSYFFTLINKFARERESNFNLKGSFLFYEQKRINFEKETKFLFNAILTDTNNQKKKKKIMGIKKIRKKVPRWSYKLISELEQQEGEGEEEVPIDHEIRSRKAKRVVIFSDNKGNSDTTNNDTNNTDQTDEVALIRYSQQSDFRRDLIKGSMRAQRRKTVIWELFQANVHSLLFFKRIDKQGFLSFDTSGLMKLIFRNWMRKGAELKISDYIEEEKKKEENTRKEKERIEIAEAWDTIPYAQIIRGLMLLTQSTLRKYILLPSLILVKNIVRILLLQFPEWSEDLKEWNREIHIKCTYNGVQLSESEFPKNWLVDGIQIKILFPFCLKPWHGSKLRYSYINQIKKKSKKKKFCFLTVWGMETELPFGSPRKRPSFFEPILKKLEKKFRNLKKKYFSILQVLKTRINPFLIISKKINKWFSKSILFFKKIIKEIAKKNKILFNRLKEVDKSNETKKEKDFIMSNQIINESMSKIRSRHWTKFLLTEKKMNGLTDRTSTIRKKIERITKEKKNGISEKNVNPNTNKSPCNATRFELTKTIWQLVKRRSIRLIRKFFFFFSFLIEKIYIDILLSIINITRIHTKLFFESTKTKNIIENPISNTKTNQNFIDFILTIKKSLYNISNKNSHNLDELSSFSQAYVFYKLSQIQVLNLFKLRSILKYHGTSFFIKTSIQNFFRRQGIIDSEFKDKKFPNSKKNQWKDWLRGYYQSHLSRIRWSKLKLIAQKWRKSTQKYRKIQDTNLNKKDSYEKEELSYYKKQNNDYKVYLLPNQKDNFQKYYRYNLLSYKSINSINYEKKEDPSIYRLPLQGNKTKKNSSNYHTQKRKNFNRLDYIPINHFIEKSPIIYMEQNTDRNYFDWEILCFYLKNKKDIETWVKVNTNMNQNIKTEAPNYQLIETMEKKDLFYFLIHQNEENNSYKKKKKWDWMEMNGKILNHPISTMEFWFFPEFFLFYNAYKMKPWFIPSKFLFLNFNINENLSETQNINRKQKEILPSNEKKYLEFKNKKEFKNQRDLRSNMQNQENVVSAPLKQENKIAATYSESDMKKLQKKKQYKSNTEAELDFFLKRYLLFQLRWDGALNQKMINNIKVYCLLLRLKNPKKITLSSIQSREINLDIMLIQKNFTLTELMKRGKLIIEPLRLPVKKSGQFIMHQTINISLVHKSRHRTNQRYRQKRYAKKEAFDKSIQKANNNYYLLFPENILASRRRRELRILICFHSKNSQGMDKNRIFCNGNNLKGYNPFLNENKDLDRHQLMKLKLFLWPNYRLEDLACMNRYWFDTNNGSRFSLLRIHMYPTIEK